MYRLLVCRMIEASRISLAFVSYHTAGGEFRSLCRGVSGIRNRLAAETVYGTVLLPEWPFCFPICTLGICRYGIYFIERTSQMNRIYYYCIADFCFSVSGISGLDYLLPSFAAFCTAFCREEERLFAVHVLAPASRAC